MSVSPWKDWCASALPSKLGFVAPPMTSGHLGRSGNDLGSRRGRCGIGVASSRRRGTYPGGVSVPEGSHGTPSVLQGMLQVDSGIVPTLLRKCWAAIHKLALVNSISSPHPEAFASAGQRPNDLLLYGSPRSQGTQPAAPPVFSARGRHATSRQLPAPRRSNTGCQVRDGTRPRRLAPAPRRVPPSTPAASKRSGTSRGSSRERGLRSAPARYASYAMPRAARSPTTRTRTTRGPASSGPSMRAARTSPTPPPSRRRSSPAAAPPASCAVLRALTTETCNALGASRGAIHRGFSYELACRKASRGCSKSSAGAGRRNTWAHQKANRRGRGQRQGR